ncbi:Transcriptional regulator, LysR family [Granulibacter bethesdensis]|uniref:Transcriptional regulator, LysR family n=1 Tax=Granulibacter bethesdensis TaxID=364410 RepID=A0AAN0VGD9_9PROT|nr:LysR family transcriptional regulator [Granulibacter bethesdensis]AHJ63532.1 Transcriptional regulator, LysR family [Granulibacter bethesdensis]
MRHLRILTHIVDVARSGSIRRSAERMNITASALTRQIQDFEEELGIPVFERTAQGMRLNAAGELIVQHALTRAADLDQIRSRIADLQGVRRGHVTVVCSQAFARLDLPREIETCRRLHPLVSFSIRVLDHSRALEALRRYEADLALVLQRLPDSEIQPLLHYTLPLCAVMAWDHPLARRDGAPVRLRACLAHRLALPERGMATRQALDEALLRLGQTDPEDIAVDSDSMELLTEYVRRAGAVTFQAASPLQEEEAGDLCLRPLDPRDAEPVSCVLGHLRGRVLSVAAAKFADQLARSLHARYGH